MTKKKDEMDMRVYLSLSLNEMSQINEKFVITGCPWKALFFRSITTVINLFDTLSASYNGVANDGNFFNLTLNMCLKLSFLNAYILFKYYIWEQISMFIL